MLSLVSELNSLAINMDRIVWYKERFSCWWNHQEFCLGGAQLDIVLLTVSKNNLKDMIELGDVIGH